MRIGHRLGIENETKPLDHELQGCALHWQQNYITSVGNSELELISCGRMEKQGGKRGSKEGTN